MSKATDETITGERGIAMIDTAVGAMGHVFHEAPGPTDFGIDGEIELRDPGTGEVRNVRIGVQSRATTKRWPGETDERFFYRPSERHVRYWLSGSQPVLLVCSRPETQEIYWRSVQEWARDPAARATGRIAFDKHRDRFDASTRDALFDLQASAADRAEPPSPAHEPEGVLLNLMPIAWSVGQLYSARLDELDPAVAFSRARDRRVHDFAAVLRDGYVWSLTPFAAEFVEAIGARDIREGALDPWLDSDEHSDTSLVRDLVRRWLVSHHHRWLTWHREQRLAYFRRRRPDWQPVTYLWAGPPGRTVVAPQQSKTRDGYTGYRHDAAGLTVRRVGCRWFLQVRPTYIFTWDGRQLSGHHESALSTIKRLETHPAVSQAVRMWAHLLEHRPQLDASDPPVALGPLVALLSPRSAQDNAWKLLSPADLGRVEPTLLAEDLTLF